MQAGVGLTNHLYGTQLLSSDGSGSKIFDLGLNKYATSRSRKFPPKIPNFSIFYLRGQKIPRFNVDQPLIYCTSEVRRWVGPRPISTSQQPNQSSFGKVSQNITMQKIMEYCFNYFQDVPIKDNKKRVNGDFRARMGYNTLSIFYRERDV